MIKFKTTLRVGNRAIEIEETVENANQMFERLAYWDSWVIKAPANDVYFRYRVTKEKGFKYYSLVCPSADKEFHFGQLMDGKNTLFPKHKEGWVPRYHAEASEEAEEVQQEPVPTRAHAATAAQSPATIQTTSKPAKSEQEQVGEELTRLVWGKLVVETTKLGGGDFMFALLGVPKAQASVPLLRAGIAAASAAIRQPALLQWAAAKWRAETDNRFSLASKMNCLGWMVRFLGDGGDFKDLQQKINGDPTTKDYKSFRVMHDNLQSWFTADEKVPEDKDIGF